MFSLGIKQDTNLPNGDNIVVHYFSILPIKGKVFKFNLITSFPKCDPDKISFETKKLDSIRLSILLQYISILVVYYCSILPIKGKFFRFNLIASFPKCDPDKISFEIYGQNFTEFIHFLENNISNIFEWFQQVV